MNERTYRGAAHWGYHLLLNAGGCNQAICEEATIRRFVKTLVERIDMVAVGECHIAYMLDGTYNAGHSVLQLIETSNIAIHFVQPSRTAYLDVFSCKEFNAHVAIEVFREFFAPQAYSMQFLTRDAPLVMEQAA